MNVKHEMLSNIAFAAEYEVVIWIAAKYDNVKKKLP